MSSESPPVCTRCGREIVANAALSADVFEGMHWLCFHLEFEHPGDPDLPCTDPSCHEWRLQVYEAKLRSFGSDPAEVIEEAVKKRWA